MSGSRKESSDDPESVPQQTALVRHTGFRQERWNGPQPPSGEAPEPGSLAGLPYVRELSAVWMQLGQQWSTIVIVPSEPDYPTAEIARALSQVGARLSIYPVEFIDARNLDVESSARLIARMKMNEEELGPPADAQPSTPSAWAPPITRTVLALESPLANPLVVPIALASDGAVLCVRRGRDHLASVRDTIQALGRRLIVCCMFLE